MFLKNITSIATIFFLFSCSSVKNHIKSEKKHSLDSTTLDKAQGSGAIKLLPHQFIPIDYLKKHPQQKGLLINHYMGTGKTYLGIGMAESFPEYPVIILAPKFLESHWQNEIENYGVKDKKRFTFVSYENAPSKLSDLDLSKYILLIDEAHNLMRKMRSFNPKIDERYGKLYLSLRKAYKIIALTGTPLYQDESDLAYMINLVSGEDLMPFNREEFRLRYTEILRNRQFFRGYLTESNLMFATSALAISPFLAAIFGPAGIIGLPIGFLAPVFFNEVLFPASGFSFRKLNAEKMLPFMRKYVSYFKFDDSHFKDFPAQDFKIEEISYNRYQYSFFLHLVEGDLPTSELQRLLKNEGTQKSDTLVNLESSQIQERMASIIGTGRDIGNFEFKDKEGNIVEPPKFVEIYKEMLKHPEQTVIYSNYYETGILAFKDFLARQGYKGRYAIIEPNLSVSEVNDIVKNYNRGDINLLLLHPEVTEGVSLKGTQYLHILEPMLNVTVLEQVIGRTRRFQSHSHLPKEKQLVKVRMWQSTSSAWNPEIGDIKRADWYKRYRELSYMSRWGIGLAQVDKKYDKKALNPEELAILKLRSLEKNLASMQALLTKESIENNYEKAMP